MKIAIPAVAAIVGALLVAAPLSSASANDVFSGPQSEFSGAKKRKAAKVQVDPYARYRAQGIAPSFGFIHPPGYPGEYAWRKSLGQCVTDLGYGRFDSCDSAGSGTR
jgi:hypothetical protein